MARNLSQATKDPIKTALTAGSEKQAEPIVEAWGIVKADEPGDLYHPTCFMIQGDRVISVEKDTATLKIICAQRIGEILHRPRL